MTDPLENPVPLEELAAQAGHTRVVVVGGGIAGLVAALECAKVGIHVVLLEQRHALGGAVRGAEVGGLTLDVGAESYATRGGHVRALLEELGLGDDIVTPSREGAWVVGLPGSPGAAPLPKGGVLGIPGNPFAADVRRVIGWRGAWRAYVDRLRPPLTIGHEHSLGRLVRTRMGEAVLDRLVAPVTTGVYSAHPDDIDVDVAAPGLNGALTRAGSLSGAVALLTGERASAPGGAIEGIDGGMSRLVEALRARLEDLGAEVRTGAPVESVERTAHGWVVVAAGGEPEVADAVFVATPEAAARRLLANAVPSLAAAAPRPGPEVHVVTLVLDAPALDARPRGTGVLTVPGARRAKALTHSSAKWPWLAGRVPAGRHVVRVSFGSQGEEPATTGLSDEDAAALALGEASALLGVTLAPSQLVAARLERYAQAQPASVLGQPKAAAAARAAIHAVDGLAAAGAWLSGTGLAQVIPDAIGEAERVRRSALWDRSAGA
ncbi:MAG TPA: protoporphyrinogen oxidase [Microbacterium sp.]|uniref:protoporphyrinogen oxidase n=1 Tax=Microbacterium sp. TaxID=51671 RepID=UPI002D150841|nr:protoporphyrinogen oxidase [Microbacterium sp.]HWI30886.1 protoporphyrinogen oxidase [Microbacterium sp.]